MYFSLETFPTSASATKRVFVVNLELEAILIKIKEKIMNVISNIRYIHS